MRKSKIIDPVELLREAGFKSTPVRRAILLALAAATSPLSALELKKKVRSTKADAVTIYRALDAFLQSGLVRSIHLTKGTTSYELAHPEHVHHIICMQCKCVEAVPFCVRGMAKSALKFSRRFKNISDHVLSFSGTCKNCARAVR
jgi:Fe2+ or Zn2+ uptake regulation protein